MKTTYYTPTTLINSVEPYLIMQADSSQPKVDPTKPVKPGYGAPARILYV